MQRGGKTHAPRYRLVVAESSSPRDGRFVEVLGNYNPQARKNEKELDLKLDRIDYWLSVGAKPSDTVRTMINRARREAPAAVEVAPATQEAQVESPAPAAVEATSEVEPATPEAEATSDADDGGAEDTTKS